MSINDATPAEWDEIRKAATKKEGYGGIKEHFYRDKGGNKIYNSITEPKNDDVDSPFHYNNGNVECIEAIEAASSKEEFEGYLRGNVIKYIWRFRYKDGEKDLRKAKWYLEKLISFLEKSNVGS